MVRVMDLSPGSGHMEPGDLKRTPVTRLFTRSGSRDARQRDCTMFGKKIKVTVRQDGS